MNPIFCYNKLFDHIGKKVCTYQPEITDEYSDDDDNKSTNNSSENESDIENKNQPENQNSETSKPPDVPQTSHNSKQQN